MRETIAMTGTTLHCCTCGATFEQGMLVVTVERHDEEVVDRHGNVSTITVPTVRWHKESALCRQYLSDLEV